MFENIRYKIIFYICALMRMLKFINSTPSSTLQGLGAFYCSGLTSLPINGFPTSFLRRRGMAPRNLSEIKKMSSKVLQTEATSGKDRWESSLIQKATFDYRPRFLNPRYLLIAQKEGCHCCYGTYNCWELEKRKFEFIGTDGISKF